MTAETAVLPGMRPGWESDAGCQRHEVDPALFYPVGLGRRASEVYKPAGAICARCPVKLECLLDAAALEASGVPYGMRAGLTPGGRSQPKVLAAWLRVLAATRAAVSPGGRLPLGLHRLVVDRLDALAERERAAMRRREEKRFRERARVPVAT